MKRKQTSAASWVVDYSAARSEAIRWLGDRYLLARPINAIRRGSRPPPPVILGDTPETPVAHTRH